MAVDADAAGGKLAEALAGSTDPATQSDVSSSNNNQLKSRRDATASTARYSICVSLAMVVAMVAVAGWFGWRACEWHQHQLRHNAFLGAARQAAGSLTTIKSTEVEADIQRIVDSSTGTFRDDFQHRSQPFITVVKQAHANSQGSITEAAIESETRDSARVLVAVTVNTSANGVAEPPPRAWRMRIEVRQVGDNVKVSDVEFVG